MRIRSIRPEFWDDPVVGRMSFGARLLYIGLWNVADDAGRFRWLPKKIGASLFPYDEDVDVDALLSELVELGRVLRYEVENQVLGFIPTFVRYQKPNRPTPSVLPEWRKQDTHGGLSEDSVSRPEPERLRSVEIVTDRPVLNGGLTEDSLRAHGGLIAVGESRGEERRGVPEGSREEPNAGEVVPIVDAEIPVRHRIKNTLADLFGRPTRSSGWNLFERIASTVVADGYDEVEVVRRARLLFAEWGRSACTASSLEKHWNRYGPDSEIGQVPVGTTAKTASRESALAELRAALDDDVLELESGS